MGCLFNICKKKSTSKEVPQIRGQFGDSQKEYSDKEKDIPDKK